MGAVYCSTMAFAAVVSLLAATNSRKQAHRLMPAPTEYRLTLTGTFFTSM